MNDPSTRNWIHGKGSLHFEKWNCFETELVYTLFSTNMWWLCYRYVTSLSSKVCVSSRQTISTSGEKPWTVKRCFWQNVILADLFYLLPLVNFFVFNSFCHLKAVVIDVSGFTLKSGQCEMVALELLWMGFLPSCWGSLPPFRHSSSSQWH